MRACVHACVCVGSLNPENQTKQNTRKNNNKTNPNNKTQQAKPTNNSKQSSSLQCKGGGTGVLLTAVLVDCLSVRSVLPGVAVWRGAEDGALQPGRSRDSQQPPLQLPGRRHQQYIHQVRIQLWPLVLTPSCP